MPVKVRCPECEKVLTLPDQARGKAVKCPACAARVPVPGAKKKSAPPKAAAAVKRRPAAEMTEEDMFASLDLSRVEDQKVRVCPKCGIQVDEEDIECPKCGVNLTTGRLSAERLRKKERGGPDTDKYYQKFVSSGWEFLKEQWGFGARTVAYVLISLGVFLFAGYMAVYTSRLPLKAFWGVISLLFVLMGPGWCWFLHTTIINWSIDKKVKLDRVRFDFFTCVAMGIKLINWTIVFCAPFLIVFGTVGGIMVSNDVLIGGLAVIALGFLPAFFCFPVVMSHMAMPQQWPGWLSPKILPQYFQGMVAPSMYWCMFFVGTMLPAAILAAVAVFGFHEDVTKVIDDLNHNARVAHVMSLEEPKKNATGGEETEIQGQVETQLNDLAWWFSATNEQKLAERQYYAGEDGGAGPTGGDSDEKPSWEREVDLESAVVPGILLLVACVPFGFAAVFNMRTNGLFTYYYRPELQLLAEEKQTVWKRKDQEFDDDGKPIESADLGKYFTGVGGTVLFYVVINVILYFATGGEYLLLPRPIAQALNLINNSGQ